MVMATRRHPTRLSLGSARDSFLRSLLSAGMSSHTVKSYRTALDQLQDFLDGHGVASEDVDALTADDIADFLIELRGPAPLRPLRVTGRRRGQRPPHGYKPGTIATRFDALKAFFTWLEGEGEISLSPMHRMKRPKVPVAPVGLIDLAMMKRLLTACRGNGFEARRDAAIGHVLWDTGLRVGGLASMTVRGTDLGEYLISYVKKGGDRDQAPIGAKTVAALDRYLRLRNSHPAAAHPAFWLGQDGPLTTSGIRQLLVRRAQQAGLDKLYPHQFRHAFCHRWLAAGGNESDLITIMGWTSGKQLQRYGLAGKRERAAQAHRRIAPGDDV
jgi:site-specific recombinase XerD